MEETMPNADTPRAPTHAEPPRAINHVVLNVRNLEVSHRFWTEIIGFRCVAELKPIPGRQRPKMRFYSGLDAHGGVTHHDLALAEVPETDGEGGGGGARRRDGSPRLGRGASAPGGPQSTLTIRGGVRWAILVRPESPIVVGIPPRGIPTPGAPPAAPPAARPHRAVRPTAT